MRIPPTYFYHNSQQLLVCFYCLTINVADGREDVYVCTCVHVLPLNTKRISAELLESQNHYLLLSTPIAGLVFQRVC